MATFQFNYNLYNSKSELEVTYQQLITEAQQIVSSAIAPYSKFEVGCAVLLKNGKTVTGFNIENASYPVTICAERTCLSAVLTQYPKEEIIAIAISYKSKNNDNSKPLAPCGLCRQFMLEVEELNKKDIQVLLSGQQGEIIVLDTIKNLLPFTFSSQDL